MWKITGVPLKLPPKLFEVWSEGLYVCLICTQTSVTFVMVSSIGFFCFTGLGHVNMKKVKDGGHSSSPLTAVIHSSFRTQGHPNTAPNRMPSVRILPS